MSTSEPGAETFEKKVLETENQLEGNRLSYYTEKSNASSVKTYDEELFINLSLRKIIENISKTFVGIMNDIVSGRQDYLAIISSEDRLIYIGIIILFIAFCIYLVDITS